MTRSDDNSPTALADAATRAASRFWQERASGRDVSVDDVLETAPGTPEHAALRAATIRAIAHHAATVGGAGPVHADQAATIVGGGGASILAGPGDSLVTGGPMPVIEGYELVSCLGRGGMGAVFEGYQQSTGRRVAVKFMLDSAASSEAARKRFEREVEVVARFQHPGIVSIIDSGVRKGRYFYVMEYVPGRPLDSALVAGDCDPRVALTLVARVCDAVDYAHQRGVLHRDLKPSNIIVDEQGLPHLLDFGLAKVFDPASKTTERHGALGLTVSGPGQIMGTVAYMSPEQAQGRHDETSVRTDVYSLGSIAYELLTGTLACGNSGSLREVLERITQVDPAAPSALRPRLSRDLDAVILRSLEKAPEKRYATAGELAADIRRSLAGEPVLARRVTTAGRAWRWVRRNRAISTVSAAAVVTLVVVSTVLITRVIRESTIAARERDLAQENFNRLRTMLESADPDRNPGLTILQLLDSAAKGLDDAPPAQQLAEAQIREVLGTVYRKFWQYDKAREQQTKALAVRERSAAGHDDPALAEALHNLAATLWWDGSYKAANDLYMRSLEMRRRMYKGDHALIATSLTHLAACRMRMGNLGEARSLYKEALAMRTRLLGPEHEEVAQSLNNLARCYLESDDLDRAESLFRQSLDMIHKLRGEIHTGTAAASQNLADCLLRRAEAAEIAGDRAQVLVAADGAKAALERALAIRTTMYPNGHHLTAATLSVLARTEVKLGNLAHAEELAHQSVDLYRRTRRADHPDVAEGLGALGTVLAAEGDAKGAAAALNEALTLAQRARPPVELQVAKVRGEYAMALAKTGRPDEAESEALRSLRDTRALRGDDSLDTVLVARRVAEFYTLRGQPARAAEYRALARLGP